MKTKSIIGALAIVLLSFAACEKPDLNPAHPIAERSVKSDQNITVPIQRPHLIKNAVTGEQQHFIYDSKNRLIKINGTSEIRTFEYDALGRVSRIATTDMKRPAERKELTLDYGETKSRLPFKAVEKIKDMHDNTILLRTILLKFNAVGQKISETEFSDNLAFEVKRTEFEYDQRRNLISKTVYHDQDVVSRVKLSDYDTHPSALHTLPLMQLIPGEVNQHNNARLIETIDSTGKQVMESRSIIYNQMGWPVEEYLSVSKNMKLLKVFQYVEIGS